VKVKEVIVVEGKHDTTKIKQAVDADTIETNGAAIPQATLSIIQHAQQKRGVIIFTDPDYPGERIRHIIDKQVPGCKHAFLTKKAATPSSMSNSIGIEHATAEAIQSALKNVYELADDNINHIEKSDLMHYGLIGSPDAKELRELLGETLCIGYTNGKQLVNRLNMFQITKNELDRAMWHILGMRR
jgi:ribonuclease M5